MTMTILLTLAVLLIIGGSFAVTLLQQASAFQNTCNNSIIDTTCSHQGAHDSKKPDKTPFILPFP
jgi:hypothetical protein